MIPIDRVRHRVMVAAVATVFRRPVTHAGAVRVRGSIRMRMRIENGYGFTARRQKNQQSHRKAQEPCNSFHMCHLRVCECLAGIATLTENYYITLLLKNQRAAHPINFSIGNGGKVLKLTL